MDNSNTVNTSGSRMNVTDNVTDNVIINGTRNDARNNTMKVVGNGKKIRKQNKPKTPH
jgi:hypothetical protein